MFVEAWQEHCDHVMGSDTEYRNMHAIERATMRADDKEEIYRLADSGKFVAVMDVTEYGPVTDAIIGGRWFKMSVHDERVQAEAVIAAIPPDEHEPDVYYMVYPPKPIEPRKYVPYDGEDDIPF